MSDGIPRVTHRATLYAYIQCGVISPTEISLIHDSPRLKQSIDQFEVFPDFPP